MSYTPGPWYVATKQDCDEDGCYDKGVYDREIGVFAVIDGEPETIATPWLEADARLIAAAPDMKDEIDRLKAEKADLLEILEAVISLGR